MHRVAREQEDADIDGLGLAICERILDQHPTIGLARVELAEAGWARLEPGGKTQGQAFTPAGVSIEEFGSTVVPVPTRLPLTSTCLLSVVVSVPPVCGS